MIRGARSFMTQDPLGIFIPCAALALTIFAINLFCDRLRDALDPKGNMLPKRRSALSFSGQKMAKGFLSDGMVASAQGLELGAKSAKRRLYSAH